MAVTVTSSLKTDYKDASWSGKRLFSIADSGSYKTITDVTSYSVTGDDFGASDLNGITTAVQNLESAKNASRKIGIAASAWSSSTTTVNGRAYYTASVSVTAIYNDYPSIVLEAAGTLPTETEESNFGLINYAIANASTNKIVFYATQKPTATVYVRALGVE